MADGLEQLPGRTIQIGNKEWLYFGGTSYLGIPDNSHFQALLRQGIALYPAHFGGSRLGRIQPAIFEKAEKWLCDFTGANNALITSSGSLAGQLLMKCLKGDFFCAPGLHPALWNGSPAFDGPFSQWVSWMQNRLPDLEGNIIIAANSVDPLYLENYNFQWLETIDTNNKKITLVIDDSHGLGIIGTIGGGTFSQLKHLQKIELVVTSSLGKALGIPGGVILGSESLIRTLWQSPFFGGASPPPPAYLYAMCRAEQLYHKAMISLKSNIVFFQEQLSHHHLILTVAEYPVIVVHDPNLALWLAKRGIMISQLPYPSPDSPLITRIVINAAHTQEDILHLCESIKQFSP